MTYGPQRPLVGSAVMLLPHFYSLYTFFYFTSLAEKKLQGQEQLIGNGPDVWISKSLTFVFILLVSRTTKHTNSWNDQLTAESGEELTSEEVRLKAPNAHEFVHQHPVFMLVALPNQFHQVLLP